MSKAKARMPTKYEADKNPAEREAFKWTISR